MKNILIMPAWYPDEISSAGIFVQDQAQALSRNNRVLIFYEPALTRTRSLKAQLFMPDLNFAQQSDVLVYRKKVLMYRRLELIFFWSFLWLTKRWFSMILKGWGRPDILHAHVSLPSGWAAAKLGEMYQIPVVLTEHCGPFSMLLKTPLSRKLVRETLLKAKRVVAVSPSLEEDIVSFEPSVKIDVIGNLVRTGGFPLLKARDHQERVRTGLQLLCVAFLYPPKGIEFLVRAVSLINKDSCNIKLVIGGTGPDMDRLKSLANELGVSERVTFAGAMNREDVSNWMQWCDVFVLPSLGETFGLVLAEAMACGKPVIATRCGGPEYFVTPETGMLVNPGDSEELANAIRSLEARWSSYNPVQIRNYIMERFGETVFLQKIEKIYEEASV